MGSASRTLGLLAGGVFTTGFIYALRRNVEKDISTQQERLKDVDFLLQTSFLPEADQAAIKDTRPLYREVHEKPYILNLYEESKSHTSDVLIPQMKNDWNARLISTVSSLSKINIDLKNWSFSW